MSPIPSGRLLRTPAGRDLVVVRTFRAPIEDVWASITESERTARWFGSWTGEPGPGRTIQVTMGFEEGTEPTAATIEACEPPRHLSLRTQDAYGSWHLEAHLSEAGGVTELRFTHHLDAKVDVGDVGPGWEYYLDMLAASREDAPLPRFEDYYPAQKEYYLGLEAESAEAAG
ncbi:MAG TPA: SRPBCC family protein [Longimicrobiaceae bacterium]|nr:SRPBCC family protein [Longimicrobiaceae bacterium]